MEYVSLSLLFLSLAVAYLTGISSIFAALLLRKTLSQRLARTSVWISLVASVLCMFVVGEHLPLVGYILIALPAGLGQIAKVICLRHPDTEALPVKQFSLGAILFVVTLVAACLGMVAAARR